MSTLRLAFAASLCFATLAAAQPANDACANALPVVRGLPAATGTNVGATRDGPTPACVSNNGPDVWFRYVTTANSGQVVIDTCGSDFDTILTAYLTDCPTGQSDVLCNDDSDTCAPGSLQSRVQINPTPTGGDVLLIRVHGFSGATGNIVLNINTCQPAIVSTFGDGSFCNQGFRTIGVNVVGQNNTFQWFEGNFNNPIPDTNSRTLDIPLGGFVSRTFFCRVTNACGVANSGPITLNNAENPQVAQQPASVTSICYGSSGSISVGFNDPSATLQWIDAQDQPVVDGTLPNGTVVSGATTSTLTFSSVAFDSFGPVRCRATNACGTGTSNPAAVVLGGQTVTVNPGPNAIQLAIESITGCGRILVNPGTYSERVRTIGKRIRLESTGGPAVTTIDAGSQTTQFASAVSATGANADFVVVKGFTITGGRGFQSVGTPLRFGGGIYISMPANSNPSYPLIQNCVIHGNDADIGGGVFVFNGTLRMSATVVRNNQVILGGGGGAGVAGTFCALLADRCEFVGNQAPSGGGGAISINQGTPTRSLISNSLIARNSALGAGGVVLQDASIELANCTIAGNISVQGASAMQLLGANISTISNCIIWDNSAAGGPPVLFEGFAPSNFFSDIQANAGITPGFGSISADPRFVSAADYRLLPGSPCIDAGATPPISTGSFDLDGGNRFVDDPAVADTGTGSGGPVPDMGAYERNPTISDGCPGAPYLGSGTHAYSTVNATTDGPNEGGQPCSGDSRHLNDVWFRHVATCNGSATFRLCGSNFDTQIVVYRGAACPSAPGSIAACNDDSDECGLQSAVSLSVTAGDSLLVRISGFNGSVGSGSVTIGCIISCAADFNGDGDLNGDDLADYINCFFSVPPCGGADFNADGDINADDLGDYINVFFAGCD